MAYMILIEIFKKAIDSGISEYDGSTFKICQLKIHLLNRKIIVGGVVAVFVIIIGIIGVSGSSFIDDTSGGNFISPSDTPREALPLEFELEYISILEVNEKACRSIIKDGKVI